MGDFTKPAATDVDLRGIGRNLCQPIRECPASQYLVCGCLETGQNCWDIEDKPCCKRDEYERCLSCEIYLAAVAQEKGKPGE
ncbi:MAG: hypothetical protein COZ06_31505 [Armatimonadetes bacterium CG_4_10_14_3_um_filter_66_18]|nr:hypothetical protein [Armatimonadota bacterium]OIO93786.1 MAG: hypothetical protein AUJ96_29720 [Armatimonadetes bacterium CG2_30_66_41]PIU93857.1 MAG: hypothetical protein COS65_10705 [Armatimonadetes bacterium CG06_land_8_20_14_3_00_66_21]PIX36951.1 MAG: hypothetical protein COZ57_36805 [Armatimonadetes bacterium CG_4_8_14_3_um_filter_66_20]PIY38248.1 MAG: hypothetical protein COZ06_31505 [Armatimonadetes bacterium CG_4_10_14_3_um_filter_66_18]PIZ30796.1 MAG: hypothetical protein COY42_33